MTTYRVGPAGAVVHAADGRPLVRLLPGMMVVEGVLGTPAPHGDVPDLGGTGAGVPPAAEPPRRIHDGRRVRGYDDKRVVPADDKGAS